MFLIRESSQDFPDDLQVWVTGNEISGDLSLRSAVPQGRTHVQPPQASTPSPSIEDPGRWVDILSEREAKQLLLVRLLTTIDRVGLMSPFTSRKSQMH
jgi:hypothetical protein